METPDDARTAEQPTHLGPGRQPHHLRERARAGVGACRRAGQQQGPASPRPALRHRAAHRRQDRDRVDRRKSVPAAGEGRRGDLARRRRNPRSAQSRRRHLSQRAGGNKANDEWRIANREHSTTAEHSPFAIRHSQGAAMYENLLANVPTDLWIGGKWKKSSDGQRFDVIDPATENKITSVASASVEDAKAAVDAASDAFEGWAAKKPRERAEILRKSYELIIKDSERFAKLMTLENGK